MALKCVLLGQALVLLWASVAGAEVLLQPDFDARKVTEAPCCGVGGHGGRDNRVIGLG